MPRYPDPDNQTDYVPATTVDPKSVVAPVRQAAEEFLGPSILRQAYAAWELKQTIAEYYREYLYRFAPQPETAQECIGRMIAENLAAALQSCLEAEIAALEARRWQGYLTRALRKQPGIRFADLIRGPERN